MTMEGYSYLLALVLFIFVVVTFYVYGRKAKPIVIETPVLGLLDLSEGVCAADVKSDRERLASFFNFVLESKETPPKCDVLFLYCEIEADGSVRGSSLGLRELIRESGALIVVVAKENPAEAYVAASKATGYGLANLMMVIDRKGSVFGEFFYKLFSAMKDGISTPVAFAKLAPPPISGVDESHCPGVLFCVEAGQTTFGRQGSSPGQIQSRSLP